MAETDYPDEENVCEAQIVKEDRVALTGKYQSNEAVEWEGKVGVDYTDPEQQIQLADNLAEQRVSVRRLSEIGTSSGDEQGCYLHISDRSDP